MAILILSGGGGSNNWIPLILLLIILLGVVKSVEMLIHFIKRKMTQQRKLNGQDPDSLPFTQQFPFHDN